MSEPDPQTDDVLTKIAEVLAHRKVIRISMKGGLTRAAVLVPLLLKKNSYHVLFTKRTDRVKHHKGEISFPGGNYDAIDGDLMATALRETREEIGVNSDDVEVLGELDEVVTMSDFIISPFVGVIPYPYTFIPCVEEIEEIILLPLSCFLKEGILTEEPKTYLNKTRMVYTYRCGEHVIWGATAKILRQFLELIPLEGLG